MLRSGCFLAGAWDEQNILTLQGKVWFFPVERVLHIDL